MRASSVALSSSIQRRSARARRVYACRSGRKKRPHRSALCIRHRDIDHADVLHQRAHVRSRKEADLACLGWIYRVEQLYTDAALVLDASTRAAAAARSGLIDLRFAPPPRFDLSQVSARLFCRPLRNINGPLSKNTFCAGRHTPTFDNKQHVYRRAAIRARAAVRWSRDCAPGQARRPRQWRWKPSLQA